MHTDVSADIEEMETECRDQASSASSSDSSSTSSAGGKPGKAGVSAVQFTKDTFCLRRLGGRVVSVLDSGAEGSGFKSQPRRRRVTVLGKLFTPSVHQAAKLVAALLRVAGVNAGLAESNGSLPPDL